MPAFFQPSAPRVPECAAVLSTEAIPGSRWHALADSRPRAASRRRGQEALAALEAPDTELLELLGAATGASPLLRRRGEAQLPHQREDAGTVPRTARTARSRSSRRAKIERYQLVSKEEIVAQAERAVELRASTCCIVISARGTVAARAERRHPRRCARSRSATPGLKLCACLGLVDDAQASALADAGVERYNHNLNTSADFYDSICSTHGHADRVETVQTVARAGLSPCSGVIVGMGETLEQLVDACFALREHRRGVDPGELPAPDRGHAARGPAGATRPALLPQGARDVPARVPGSRDPPVGRPRGAPPLAAATRARTRRTPSSPPTTSPSRASRPRRTGAWSRTSASRSRRSAPRSDPWRNARLFVTGTDTGVGKTVVTAGLARALRAQAAWSRSSSRCRAARSRRIRPVTRHLARGRSTSTPFDAPLAPLVAARRAGVTIELEPILRRAERLGTANDVVVVEGAGGLPSRSPTTCSSPTSPALSGCPLVIVARAGPRHGEPVLLTIEAARAAGSSSRPSS